MYQITTLTGCDRCGNPNYDNYFYCKKCLLNDYYKTLEDVRLSDYLDPQFRNKLIAKYQNKINDII